MFLHQNGTNFLPHNLCIDFYSYWRGCFDYSDPGKPFLLPITQPQTLSWIEDQNQATIQLPGQDTMIPATPATLAIPLPILNKDSSIPLTLASRVTILEVDTLRTDLSSRMDTTQLLSILPPITESLAMIILTGIILHSPENLNNQGKANTSGLTLKTSSFCYQHQIYFPALMFLIPNFPLRKIKQAENVYNNQLKYNVNNRRQFLIYFAGMILFGWLSYAITLCYRYPAEPSYPTQQPYRGDPAYRQQPKPHHPAQHHPGYDTAPRRAPPRENGHNGYPDHVDSAPQHRGDPRRAGDQRYPHEQVYRKLLGSVNEFLVIT